MRKRKKIEQERKMNKIEIFMFVFLSFALARRKLGIFFTTEEQILLVCELFVPLCCGFQKAAAIP